MQTTGINPASPAPSGAGVRRITNGDLKWALGEGWKDFREMRGDLLLAGLLYPLIGLVAAAVAVNNKLLPLFFPLVAGLSILGPAVASGFYELARRREEGLESSWRHFFDPVRGRGRGQLGILTLGLAGLFVAWLVIAWAIYGATIGSDMPNGVSGFFRTLFYTREGWTMIVIGNLVGFGFAIATLVLTIVSFPMVVDKGVDSGIAILTSLRAARENPGVMASWGLRVAALLLLGCLPAFIGLAVVLPVLGYATWHLYTRLVVR